MDFLIINKKWINSIKNCRSYNPFISLASDHRIISADIRLCLRVYKNKLCINKPYDWIRLNHNTDIRSSFVTEVKNRF